jgi:hypothetical protein
MMIIKKTVQEIGCGTDRRRCAGLCDNTKTRHEKRMPRAWLLSMTRVLEFIARHCHPETRIPPQAPQRIRSFPATLLNCFLNSFPAFTAAPDGSGRIRKPVGRSA